MKDRKELTLRFEPGESGSLSGLTGAHKYCPYVR
jgi:hypothetical protein